MKFGFIILLSTAVTAAGDENTRWCNHEPSDSDLTCDGGPFVSCNYAGAGLIGHAACVRTFTSHGHVNTIQYTCAKW
ncbi:uncharacterized protein CLUP02_08215 [Colletotrichum lupini]|uniref:Uncharacterized protein n=1 Tax=Colletotrichum lupini TaxID=145971 RepID=A0A9Q8SSQ4_9PEZI|nr:uncharacterized protein CLUP02_08215 [Colletotrichum lupini]UQC82725.1 hypothetical protein CLUP02_08215 [Colletotrichum lupini]